MSNEEKLKYVEENNIEIDDIEKASPGLLHSKIGADICKKKYGFTEDMIDAIKYHTVGNPDMSLLAKVIFVADRLEENRKFEDIETYNNIVDKTLDEAIIYAIDIKIKKTIDKGNLIHPNGILTRNKLLINFK